MDLPLRLAVEPIVRSILGACFVLPSCDEFKVCFIIANEGLVALALNTNLSIDEISNITHLDCECLPQCYLCKSDNGSFLWYKQNQLILNPKKIDVLNYCVAMNSDIAKVIVESTNRYYSKQVLEPSIRGFLAILEKQFPRNDLYLFELLQNAVDDGANHIIMETSRNMKSTENPLSLHFCHNGRPFTPLDIIGLASVGLSTKGNDEKRKIGFMGVGFKAVYKRYSKVTIYDDVWSFCFEEPHALPLIEPSHSWVLKPTWVDRKQISMNSATTTATISTGTISTTTNIHPPLMGVHSQQQQQQQKESAEASPNWCHFFLQRTRGGEEGIRADLSSLPLTVPVLLGRQSLLHSDAKTWRLVWSGSCHTVVVDRKVDMLCERLKCYPFKHAGVLLAPDSSVC